MICKVCKVEKDESLFCKWRNKCKECNYEYNKKWAKDNKSRDKYISNWNKDNIAKRRKQKYIKYKENMSNDIFKLKESIRSSIRSSFINKGYKKGSFSFDILGCSYEEFSKYLESKFEPWMTWENKGKYNGELNYGWDMDHIIPISSANSYDDVIKLNHWTNFQPLCSKVNRDIKKDKVETTWIKL